MEPKADIRLDHKLDHKSIQEAKKFPLKKIVNDDVLVKDEEKPTRAIDNVDSGELLICSYFHFESKTKLYHTVQ